MAEYKMKDDDTSSKSEGPQQQQPPKNFETASSLSLPPPPEEFQTSFASLSLHQSDRIRMLDFPTAIIDLVRQTIAASWPRGIQAQRIYGGSYEFKLYGYPWKGGPGEAMHARRLMTRIFQSLWDAGWLMSLSTDISKKQLDKDTMIFRHQSPPPPRCDWISIGFSRGDRIRLMDAPVDLRQAIIAKLGPRIQESRAYDKVSQTWELKIWGNPWCANGEETMVVRRMLLHLVAVLEQFGYTVYASIDQKATSDENRSESDTWHCRRVKDWVPGAPVYHQ